MASYSSLCVGRYIDLDDDRTEPIGDYFDRTYNFINRHLEQGYNVYVHCVAGMSRSSTIVVAFLMKKFGMSVEEALSFVKDRRPIIRPNNGFLHELIRYEERL